MIVCRISANALVGSADPPEEQRHDRLPPHTPSIARRQPRGAAGAGLVRRLFHPGARGSILFLRNRGTDMDIGPYLDVATASFHNVDLGGGAEWLIPVRDDLPLVLSAGAFWRGALRWPTEAASSDANTPVTKMPLLAEIPS